MTQSLDSKKISVIFIKLLILCCLVFAMVLTGKFADFVNGVGFLFVFLGGIFLTLISFSFREMGRALKHTLDRSGSALEQRKTGYFWETVVRNFWMTGVLGCVISFVIALGSSEGGLFGIASRMSASYISAVYGMALAVICAVPALKVSGTLDTPDKEEKQNSLDVGSENNTPFLKFDSVIGYVLFLFALGWSIFTPLLGQAFEGPLKPMDLFLYWPALLVVLGGTIAIVLLVGNSAASKSFTIGFALTGMLATLMGFVQAMMGFSSKEIQDIASAITFILSSCIIALLGMMLVGNPLLDHSMKNEKVQKAQPLNRIVWFVFPFMTLILLFLTFVMVVTPIKKG
jgi:hypothetical protein